MVNGFVEEPTWGENSYDFQLLCTSCVACCVLRVYFSQALGRLLFEGGCALSIVGAQIYENYHKGSGS